MNDAVKIEDVQKGLTQSGPGKALAAASPFSSTHAFEAAQRMALALTSSTMVPKQYRGRDNLGNALIALEIAQRNNSSILMVMQNLYSVHGTPAWSGQYVIAAINQSGRFAEPLHFEFVGKEGTDDWGCYATTITRSGRQIKGPTITIGLSKAEGWYQKDGSKWKTIPELMLRYRAAAWFGRTECPEILMGMPTADEQSDIIDVDADTGEVISHGVRVRRSAGPAEKSAGGPAETDDKPSGATDAGPAETPAETSDEDAVTAEQADKWDKEIAERGYYRDGDRFFNAAGEIWNPEIHATSKVGDGPIVNKDGSFRAKPGASTTTDKEEGDRQPKNETGDGFGLD